MKSRWTVLSLAFVIPVLPLIALATEPHIARVLNVAACALGVLAALLWALGRRGETETALDNDEMAHTIKNQVAAIFLIIENAALVALLIAINLFALPREAIVLLIYILVIASVWVYGLSVAGTWRRLSK